MTDLWDDYAEFHREMVRSGDLDPVYPVYRWIADDREMSWADRVWLVLAHVAYYHAGSGLSAFSAVNGLRDAGCARTDLPCATERRGHRSPAALSAHLNDLARRADEILGWCSRTGWTINPQDGWRLLTDRLATLHGNGRWAAYKTAEMLQHIAGLPIEAPDMGHAFSSGPRKGLALLYDGLPTGNGADIVRHLDSLSHEVVAYLNYRTDARWATMATAETSLCDFHSLASGRYYVGHDIDQMQEQIAVVPSALSDAVAAARLDCFAPGYLGELNGRTGIDRARRRVYSDTGKIVTR